MFEKKTGEIRTRGSRIVSTNRLALGLLGLLLGVCTAQHLTNVAVTSITPKITAVQPH